MEIFISQEDCNRYTVMVGGNCDESFEFKSTNYVEGVSVNGWKKVYSEVGEILYQNPEDEFRLSFIGSKIIGARKKTKNGLKELVLNHNSEVRRNFSS